MFIRRLPNFTHHAPTTMAEALDLLTAYAGKAKVFAGGTDLFPAMKKREWTPEHLINLKGITDLKGINIDNGKGIHIGALCTLRDLEHSTVVKQRLPILLQALQVMASPQIRTLGTIGGNICNAVPSADTAPPLIALKASLKLQGTNGERTVPIENFFKGPKESVLREDEILAEVLIPRPAALSAGTYLKLMRRNAMDLALVGVAVSLSFDDERKICREARIALGAVAPTPLRVSDAEDILLDRVIDEARATEAACIASKTCSPRIGSIRSSEEYRRSMVEVLTKRAILDTYQNIMGTTVASKREQAG